MSFNYYLYTEDDEIRDQLIFDARQINSIYAVTKLLNEYNIYLNDYTNTSEVSTSLCKIDFKTLYKRKGTLGCIGFGSHFYEVVTDS
jgi:hypothetical protein